MFGQTEGMRVKDRASHEARDSRWWSGCGWDRRWSATTGRPLEAVGRSQVPPGPQGFPPSRVRWTDGEEVMQLTATYDPEKKNSARSVWCHDCRATGTPHNLFTRVNRADTNNRLRSIQYFYIIEHLDTHETLFLFSTVLCCLKTHKYFTRLVNMNLYIYNYMGDRGKRERVRPSKVL